MPNLQAATATATAAADADLSAPSVVDAVEREASRPLRRRRGYRQARRRCRVGEGFRPLLRVGLPAAVMGNGVEPCLIIPGLVGVGGGGVLGGPGGGGIDAPLDLFLG